MTAPDRPIVEDHDPMWADRGAALVRRLAAIGPPVVAVDHIGSTAVPGMAAKDVIDLQVAVADLDAAVEVLDPVLLPDGWIRLPYDHDHVPAGSGDDPGAWAKRYYRRRDHADGDANLHVRLAGSPNERYALLFRDWFRAHPSAVPAYAAFKRALADAVGDVATYSDVKDPVVDLVMASAEPWAAATGWTPRP